MNINNNLTVKEKQFIDTSVAQSYGVESNQKKSRRWNHPVRDKLEDVFCINKSTFIRPAYTHSEGNKEKGIAKLVETQRFSFKGKQFTEEYLGDSVILNIRNNKRIKVFALDIDIDSIYRDNYIEIIGCIEEIGLCRCLRVISSKSGGIHLWFPLKVAINARFLHIAIKAWLEENEFIVKDGTLEIFPGRGETTWKRDNWGNLTTDHLARCFRLPCQKGSCVVDEDENVIHNDIEQFWLEDFDWCAEAQDHERFDMFQRMFEVDKAGAKWENDVLVIPKQEALKEETKRRSTEVESKPKKRGRVSRVKAEQEVLTNKLKELGVPRNKYISTLKEMIKTGWTDSSQSNYLIGAVAIFSSYDNPKLGEAELAEGIIWQVKRMPGYEEFASPATKKDLESYGRDSWARRWAKSAIKYRKNNLNK